MAGPFLPDGSDVAASVTYTLSRHPYPPSTSFAATSACGVAAQASGTSLSDVSATPSAEASRISCCRGSPCHSCGTESAPSHDFFPAVCSAPGIRATPPRWRVHSHRHWSSPACRGQTAGITFQLSTRDERWKGVSGLTWHARERLVVLRRQLNSNFLINSCSHFIVYPLSHAAPRMTQYDAVTLMDRSEWHRQLFWWSSTWPELLSRLLLPWIRHLGFSTGCLDWFPFSHFTAFLFGSGFVVYLRWSSWCLARRFRGIDSGTRPCPCSLVRSSASTWPRTAGLS